MVNVETFYYYYSHLVKCYIYTRGKDFHANVHNNIAWLKPGKEKGDKTREFEYVVYI